MSVDRDDFALRAARALFTARRATRRIFVVTVLALPLFISVSSRVELSIAEVAS
jgi:hypothetical protein